MTRKACLASGSYGDSVTRGGILRTDIDPHRQQRHQHDADGTPQILAEEIVPIRRRPFGSRTRHCVHWCRPRATAIPPVPTERARLVMDRSVAIGI